MSRPPTSIGIIGGGSVGYISALYLKKTFPRMNVSLVESSRIPVIGVGEATTPDFRDFIHHKMGVSSEEFFTKARSTIKLGIRFEWGIPEKPFFQLSFGKQNHMLDALYYTGDLNNVTVQTLLMSANRVPVARKAVGLALLTPLRGYAYHVDNKRFLKFMREKLIESGCIFVDAEVDGVLQSTMDGAVASLKTTSGETLRFDMYVDCTGFRSLLLEKSMGAGWVDYSNSLFTNRAVIGTRPVDGEIRPYTLTRTLRHGWLWNTPLQEEEHLGYVFSSNHCSDAEAMEELSHHCTLVEGSRVVSFRPGRHDASWKRNVVAVGNAFAFIEPLQATGLHMALRQMKALCKVLKQDAFEDTDVAHYNSFVNTSWDKMKLMVALYFKTNRMMSTCFWKDCAEQIDMTGLEEYLEYFEQHGPLSAAPEHPLNAVLAEDAVYTAFCYDQALASAGFQAERFRRYTKQLDPDWPKKLQLNRLVVQQCIGHREAIAHLSGHSSAT